MGLYYNCLQAQLISYRYVQEFVTVSHFHPNLIYDLKVRLKHTLRVESCKGLYLERYRPCLHILD
jgi:hypothetical protein